jgi:signal transduction histidine kinase
VSTPAALHVPPTWTTGRAARASRWPWRTTLDIALTAVAAAITLALLSHVGPGLSTTTTHALGPRQVLAAALTALPILLWRRRPLITFIAVVGFGTAFAALGEVVWLPVGPALALYLLTAGRDENTPWPTTSIVIVLGLVSSYLAVAGSVGHVAGAELVHAAVAFAAAWFAGERTRLHHAHLVELHTRAERAERDAARERDLAVAEERNRIARDLHDTAAHALNVIAVRAGAARLRHDPDRDLAALSGIEDLARQTMNDIDQFVGNLRGTSGTVEVPPGLAALDTLIAQHTAAGHQVQLTRSGEPNPLAAPTDHGVYRIVQEALTNSARYGDGTTSIRVTYGADTIDLTITNGVRRPVVGKTTGGHGVIGMRERATSLGGELTAGPVGDHFVVDAHLPYLGRQS